MLEASGEEIAVLTVVVVAGMTAVAEVFQWLFDRHASPTKGKVKDVSRASRHSTHVSVSLLVACRFLLIHLPLFLAQRFPEATQLLRDLAYLPLGMTLLERPLISTCSVTESHSPVSRSSFRSRRRRRLTELVLAHSDPSLLSSAFCHLPRTLQPPPGRNLV